MSRYASKTDVSSDRSRSEIERTLARYGATSFQYGWEDRDGQRLAMVGFRLDGWAIRFLLPMPSPDDEEFTLTPTGRERATRAAEAAYEQAVRQRWRALALVVKAKLEAVDSDITSIEEEFLAHIVLPDGRTVGNLAISEARRSYELGKVPRLLLPPAPDADVVDAEVLS